MPVKELGRRKIAPASKTKPDSALVRGCLKGSDEDWNLLIDKYKNLIFSIPIRYQFSREEAADIFQSVCLELIQSLSKLERPEALPKWLMQVTAHKCFHWKRQQGRMLSRDDEEAGVPEQSVPPAVELNMQEIEGEQMLREACAALPPRCQELIRMLFYEQPARPYKHVAADLGLATGSIGLLRQQCLDRLRAQLNTLGFS